MTTSSPIKTTTNFYQHGVPSYNPSFSQQILNCIAFDKVRASYELYYSPVVTRFLSLDDGLLRKVFFILALMIKFILFSQKVFCFFNRVLRCLMKFKLYGIH